MKNKILEGKNISKAFLKTGNTNKVLDNINIDIYEGDFTIIMGNSGAGKSTLLYALSGMDNISNGKVLYKNKDISRLNEKQMADLRTKEFGFIFQQTYLVSNLSLFENITVAAYLCKEKKQEEIEERAMKLLRQMNIEKAKDRMPSQVSGGEGQRTAVARAIINNPGLIFADEPTGALNKSNTEEVLNLLTDINELGQSILMVTHDVKAASRGNRLLYLEDGKIIGEKNLPKFDKSDIKQREEELSKWLEDMSW